MVLVGGVFTGSALWWLFLSSSAALLLRDRLTNRAMVWINRTAGIIIGGFGLATIAFQIKQHLA